VRKENERGTFLLVAGIVLLGALLRIYGLTAQALWYDELSTVSIALKGLKFILQPFAAYKASYIVLLHGWIKIFGINAAAVRSLPAIFGICSLYLAFRLGAVLFSRRVGLVSAFLLAISVFHVYQSQQSKHHAFLMFCALLSFLFFAKWIAGRKPRYLAYATLTNVVALFTHPFAFFIILIQEISVFSDRGMRKALGIKKWIGYKLPLIAALIAWAAIIRAGDAHLRAISWWVDLPDQRVLFDTFRTFCYGWHYGLSDARVPLCPPGITVLLCALFAVLFARGLFFGFRHYPLSMRIVVTWLFLPVIGTFLFSYFVAPAYVIKHLFILLPAFNYIVAIGLVERARVSFIALALVSIFLLISFPLRIMYTTNPNLDWSAPVRFMKENGLRDDALIILGTTKESVCLMYYLSGGDSRVLRDIDMLGKLTPNGWEESFGYNGLSIVTLGSERQRDFGSYRADGAFSDFEKKAYEEGILQADRQVWLLMSKWSCNEYYKERIVGRLLQHYRLSLQREESDIKVYCFEPRT
jgi:mannosyltransferase